jgi:RNA polymerase sigma-70 factor (ECF subfamily)
MISQPKRRSDRGIYSDKTRPLPTSRPGASPIGSYKPLVEADVYVAGDALEVPETGTTVRLREGSRRVQDGPYADTKEQLAGFIILENFLPSTPPWNGLRAAREHRSARWKSGRWRLRPSAVGSQVNQSNNQEDAQRSIERVARESYGRLLAYLSVHTHDLASAEDALSEALVAALKTWPRDGLPEKPEAWLLTVARHSLIDVIRHHQVVLESEPTLQFLSESSAAASASTRFQDERLKLLFVCAHPAIDPAMHTPLMLQTVLGLDAARIAHAFLIAPKTMGQRLSRAKTKIRSGGIRFEIPQEPDLPERLEAVLEAIYAAFGIGWDDMVGADQRGRDLAEEAIWLARVLLQLMPGEAEIHGLLALMLHCETRRAARRGRDGRYIPLSEQDPKLWSSSLIEEAERHLADASRFGRQGRFQLEAAIQSVHAERAHSGRIDWAAIARFYEELIRISPTIGRKTGYAAALAEVKGPDEGLVVLNSIRVDTVSDYQPYWAVRAHLLRRLGQTAESFDAYNRAIGLTEDPAVRQFLLQKRN